MNWLKKLLTNIWFYIVLFILSVTIPFVINIMYKLGATMENPYITMWEANDTLSFFGSYLSFFGTIVLGAVAVFQTDKANDQSNTANDISKEALKQAERANELAYQMQKFEQVKFISVISLKHLDVNTRSIEYPDYRNQNVLSPVKFDMVNQDAETFNQCYHVDVIFENLSNYPISELNVSAKGYNRGADIRHGIKSAKESVYIAPYGTGNVRFIIPSKHFEKYDTDGIEFRINFTNVFDFTTNATIRIDEFAKWEVHRKHTYKMEKVTNVIAIESSDQ